MRIKSRDVMGMESSSSSSKPPPNAARGWCLVPNPSTLLLSAFCILLSAAASAVVLPEEVNQALEQQSRAFVEAEASEALEFEQEFWNQHYYTAERFPELSGEQFSLPDASLRPLAKAILLFEAHAGVLPRVRYKVEYLRAPSPSDDFPLEIAHVQVTRFNLGPQLRQQAIVEHGHENVASAEEFGIGPHLRWRLVLQPAMGQLADVFAASRRVLSEAEAGAVDCLGTPCLALEPAWGPEDGWQALSQPPGLKVISSSLSAVVTDALAHALQGETAYGELEGEPDSEPQLIVVISQGIDGQDPPVAAVGQLPKTMDDAIQQYWVRRIQSDTSVSWEQRLVFRPGRQ